MGEALTTIIAEATGLSPVAFQVALRSPIDHQSNRLYDVWTADRHLIAKEYIQPDELVDAPAREYRALTLLAPLDIAPRPIFFQPALGAVVVYEYMEGAMWDRVPPSASDLAELADAWLAMQTLPTEHVLVSRGRSVDEAAARIRTVFQDYDRWASMRFPLGQRASERCLTLLENRQSSVQSLVRATPVLCFCRADARFANIIRRPAGGLGLIDWEDSGLRDPARDVADLLTHPNQEDLLTPAAWQHFLQPYLRNRSLVDPTIADRMQMYLGIFPLFWLSVLIQHGMRRADTDQQASWTINGLPAKGRLQRYMAQALAWPDQPTDHQRAAAAQFAFFAD